MSYLFVAGNLRVSIHVYILYLVSTELTDGG